MAKRWTLLVLVILLALVLGFVTFTPHQAVIVVTKVGYWVLLLSFGAFLASVRTLVSWTTLRSAWIAGGWKIVLFIVALSGLLHVQERHGFKVLMDEVVLLSASMRMSESRESTMVYRGHNLGVNFVPLQGGLDKRPLFYPFVLSLLHDATGYRPSNAFWLNVLLTPLFFGLLYLVTARLVGKGGGVAAVLLMATVPLLTQTMTSGGFELMNLVMILAVLLLGMEYARMPSSNALSAFCVSGTLLAQVRYESVLAVIPVGLVVLFVWWRQRKVDLPMPVILCPLLLILFPLQYNVFTLNPDMWQLSDRPSGDGVFGISYLQQNLGHALNYFWSFDKDQPSSPWVFVLGVAGVSFSVLVFVGRVKKVLNGEPQRAVWMAFFWYLLAHTVLMLAYFWGRFDDVLTARLSLPTQLMMVLSFVVVFPELAGRRRLWMQLSIASGLVLFVWTMPVLKKRSYTYTNMLAQTCEWLAEFVARERVADRNILVIDPHLPLWWGVHKVPSMTIDALAHRESEFIYHHERKTFDDIVVVQRYLVEDFKTGSIVPAASHDLRGVFELETLDQIFHTPVYVMRISRVVSVDAEALDQWADHRIKLNQTRVSDESGVRPESDEDARRKLKESEYINEWLSKLP